MSQVAAQWNTVGDAKDVQRTVDRSSLWRKSFPSSSCPSLVPFPSSSGTVQDRTPPRRRIQRQPSMSGMDNDEDRRAPAGSRCAGPGRFGQWRASAGLPLRQPYARALTGEPRGHMNYRRVVERESAQRRPCLTAEDLDEKGRREWERGDRGNREDAEG